MFINNQFCHKCNKQTQHSNGKCSKCITKIKKDKETAHFEYLDKLTLKQRIRRIEEILYNQSINNDKQI